jgi:predicted PhzF superfamily epimerase YddE/YHI9
MRLPVYQVDAFAGCVFAGNPAVVCRLEAWLPDDVLQAIASEHNISTTAFLVERGDGAEIRYFAPVGEFPLVGHASLAAAYVLLELLHPGRASLTLHRRDGTLTVSRQGELLAIQLPLVAARPCPAPPPLLAEGLGVRLGEVRTTDARYFAVFDTEAELAALAPDMDRLLRLDRDVVVTAPGAACDFVSRAFAPREGLPEDPVCGSAHLTLVPFWSQRLGKTEHHALQLSPRGGELFCTLLGNEVRLAGRCALYFEGVARI